MAYEMASIWKLWYFNVPPKKGFWLACKTLNEWRIHSAHCSKCNLFSHGFEKRPSRIKAKTHTDKSEKVKAISSENEKNALARKLVRKMMNEFKHFTYEIVLIRLFHFISNGCFFWWMDDFVLPKLSLRCMWVCVCVCARQRDAVVYNSLTANSCA